MQRQLTVGQQFNQMSNTFGHAQSPIEIRAEDR
jgi:hypothetical protein